MRGKRNAEPAGPKLPLDGTAGTPTEIWNDYFSKRRPRPSATAEMILRLHNAGRHEHVIAAVQAALIHGQAQPWMYDVLAMSMRIARRPAEDIERVLFSRVDFTGLDVPSMLYSAAHLTRFGADKQALHLYRQASRIAPHRPEPYVLGLRLARKLKDYPAVQWAAAGVLETAWTRDHINLHKQALDAAEDSQRELTKADRANEAQDMAQAIARARQRDLVLKLTWTGEADLDLAVDEPPGTRCSIDQPQTAAGGALVHDGYGPNPKNCFEEYVCARAVPGKYRVHIRHVLGTVVSKRATLTVVRHMGTDKEHRRTFTVQLAGTDTTVRLSLPQGRRTELQPVDKRIALTNYQPRRRTLLQKMGGGVGPRGQRAGRNFVASRNRSQVKGVGFQPVITNIAEGVTMQALAVVSGDRRYVKMSVSPVFSTITDVFTFSFVNSGNPNGGGGQGQGGQGGGNFPGGGGGNFPGGGGTGVGN